MLARITGAVLNTDAFSGTARESGKAFTINTAIVLVADRETVRVQYDPQVGIFPRRGDVVDWLVDCGVYRNEPQLRLTGEWPADDVVAAALAS